MAEPLVLMGDIRGHVGPNWCLYTPDGYWYGSIPYVVGYLNVGTGDSLNQLVAAEGILFSWTHAWQSLAWTKRTNQPVIVGGKHAQLLHKHGNLPALPNVHYWIGNVDEGENGLQTRVVPDYHLALKANPFCDWLMVHSGEGCSWGRCTFCTLHDGEEYVQFDPQYVAQIVLLANDHGKAAGLSANMHSLEWLEEMERYLPAGRRYDAYVRGDRTDWSRLTKARRLFIGLEYLSESVLQRVRKGLTSRQIMDSIIAAQQSGVDIESIVIVDLWQTKEEQHEHYTNVLELLRHTKRAGIEAGQFALIETRLTEVGRNYYAITN